MFFEVEVVWCYFEGFDLFVVYFGDGCWFGCCDFVEIVCFVYDEGMIVVELCEDVVEYGNECLIEDV